MSKDETILRFEKVDFEYNPNKPILDEVSFSVRQGMKLTIMGQNGAGKSTLFGLITGEYEPNNGEINIVKGTTIAIAKQVIPRDQMDLSIREFFQNCFKDKVYDIDPRIDEVLEIVHLKKNEKVHDRIVKSFSGGQQARILLASALIQEPDILLLDEPTNNLDKAGIEHLTDFLKKYEKTCLVISHDAEFLNSFTDGVLYLDVFTRKIERYVGNYYDVVKDISARVEKENIKNARLGKIIQAKKDQANVFAHKGGNLRAVAKRMRDLAADLEEELVDVRKEDKTIKPFTIPFQDDITGEIIRLESVKVIRNHKPTEKKVNIKLKKNNHLLLAGPNGIGKSTLLESIASGTSSGTTIAPGVRVGYYRQDFSTPDFNQTVYESLKGGMAVANMPLNEERLRATAAGFLLTSEVINTKIGSLSEGGVRTTSARASGATHTRRTDEPHKL